MLFRSADTARVRSRNVLVRAPMTHSNPVTRESWTMTRAPGRCWRLRRKASESRMRTGSPPELMHVCVTVSRVVHQFRHLASFLLIARKLRKLLISKIFRWCRRWDSNPHALRRSILSRVRNHKITFISTACVDKTRIDARLRHAFCNAAQWVATCVEPSICQCFAGLNYSYGYASGGCRLRASIC